MCAVFMTEKFIPLVHKLNWSPCSVETVVLCSVESFGLGVFALAESMPDVSRLPFSVPAEDKSDYEEEDHDGCRAAYDHQHPHSRLGFDCQGYHS